MQACSLVFTYTLSIGFLEPSDLLCFLIGLNQVGGRHEAQWGKNRVWVNVFALVCVRPGLLSTEQTGSKSGF